LAVAKVPCSLVRSWRMACDRMTLPSTESCTEAPTMVTSMLVRAQARPARWLAPPKLMVPPGISWEKSRVNSWTEWLTTRKFA
jgi:hypothetical protein